MSKEYYRKRIAEKRVEIVKLRAKIVDVKADKKRRIDRLNQSIKSSSSSSTKANYRQTKIRESERFKSDVESIKSKIERIKKEIETHKSSLSNAK